MSILRTFLWSEFYFVVTLIADELTGFNYGFLLHKPEAFSILSFLSDSRPLYLLQMHGVALLFFLGLYAPFAVVDLIRRGRFSEPPLPHFGPREATILDTNFTNPHESKPRVVVRLVTIREISVSLSALTKRRFSRSADRRGAGPRPGAVLRRRGYSRSATAAQTATNND